MESERDPNAPDDSDESARPPPSPQPPPTLSYASGLPPKLKTIRQLSSFEANLAAAKLESAGITCFVIDDNIATTYPLVFAPVRLQVPEDEVEQAEAVLTAPAAEPADPEAEEAAEETAAAAADEAEGEYVEESFRCSNCHRKDVEILPVSAAMRNVRFGCLIVLLLPVIISIAAWMSSPRPGGASADLFPPGAILAWLVVLGVLCFIVLTAKRRKRCRTCDYEWVG